MPCIADDQKFSHQELQGAEIRKGFWFFIRNKRISFPPSARGAEIRKGFWFFILFLSLLLVVVLGSKFSANDAT
jgi:hypothetical protein